MKQLTDELRAEVVKKLIGLNRLMYQEEITELVIALNELPEAPIAQPVQVNAMLVEALQAAEKLEHEALVALSEATDELKVGNTYTTATDTYKAHNDLIHRLDKILNSQYRDRKRAALTAAQQAQPEPATEAGTCERGEDYCASKCGTPNVCCDWYVAPVIQQAQPERDALMACHCFDDIARRYCLDKNRCSRCEAHGIKQGGQHD